MAKVIVSKCKDDFQLFVDCGVICYFYGEDGQGGSLGALAHSRKSLSLCVRGIQYLGKGLYLYVLGNKAQ